MKLASSRGDGKPKNTKNAQVSKLELHDFATRLHVHYHLATERSEFLKSSYAPLKDPVSNQAVKSGVDVDHLMKRFATHLVEKGFMDLDGDAWKQVLKDESIPNLGLNWLLRDKQNVANARLFFSSMMEEQLERNGHPKEATFCRVFRRFYEAMDSKGLTDKERVCRIEEFLEFFREVGCCFSQFTVTYVFLLRFSMSRQKGFSTMLFQAQWYLARVLFGEQVVGSV